MDPGFLERHWSSLPNLDRMRQQGDFLRLATTSPPQSPVAWSSFVTGRDPGGHGIYDFVHRNATTMSPYSAMSRTVEGGLRLPVGPYVLPLTGGRAESLRQGSAFWEALGKHGIPATIIRMPTNFPPIDCAGLSVAGMGTPDLLGTFGTFSYYTDKQRYQPGVVPGGEIFRVQVRQGAVTLHLPGPANSLRKDEAPTSVPIQVHVDRENATARFDVGDRQVVLREGEWSGWLPVRFPLLDGLADAPGMIRIYAQTLRANFAVYVSPVNIDPEEPALPITDPESYSHELAQAVGRFYTQGIAHDTAALRQGVFTRAEYLEHSRQVSTQFLRLLRFEMDRFESGLLFFHFFGVDQNSHILWGLDEGELLRTYRLVDDTVGWVLERAGDATVLVISDHGFARFDRAVHVNRWLQQAGLLSLQPEAEQKQEAAPEDIDWSRTKAYALGINGIYVNQQFRERDGIVAEGEETEAVLNQVREGLLALRDPANGEPVIHSFVEPRQQFSGDHLESAPDLIVGYYPSYRASWQTALGATPSAIIEDNRDEWRADHCIAADFVPGVYIANRPTGVDHPRLQDLGAQILAEFGIQE
jgi:predicted AlkP superfamily phosphohydrolase/phosphomutase